MLTELEEHRLAQDVEGILLRRLMVGPILLCGTAHEYMAELGVTSLDPWAFDMILRDLKQRGVIKAPFVGQTAGYPSFSAYLLLALK